MSKYDNISLLDELNQSDQIKLIDRLRAIDRILVKDINPLSESIDFRSFETLSVYLGDLLLDVEFLSIPSPEGKSQVSNWMYFSDTDQSNLEMSFVNSLVMFNLKITTLVNQEWEIQLREFDEWIHNGHDIFESLLDQICTSEKVADARAAYCLLNVSISLFYASLSLAWAYGLADP